MVDTYAGTVPNLTQTQPDFDTNTQDILDYIAGLAPQLNEWVGAYVQDTTTVSSTEHTIGNGSKIFTVEAGKGYKPDMTVRASAGGGNYMDGNVTSYSGTSLTINFTNPNGSGTFDDWDIYLNISGGATLESNTFTGPQIVPDEAYDATGWNGNLSVPTKNAVRDLIVGIIKNATNDSSFTSNASNDAASTEWVNSKALIKAGTAITANGASAYDIAIPAGVKRFSLHFDGVSTSGTSNPLIQLIDATATVKTSGYEASGSITNNAANPNTSPYTTGFGLLSGQAANVIDGFMFFSKGSGDTWHCSYNLSITNAGVMIAGSGKVSLPAGLGGARFRSVNGTDTKDAGTISPTWEF